MTTQNNAAGAISWWTRPARFAAAIAAGLVVSACAHVAPQVTRRSGDLLYEGPAFSAQSWRAALEFELEPALRAHASATETTSETRAADVAVYLTREDPHVIAVALGRGVPSAYVRLAAARTTARTGDCELRVALAASATTAVVDRIRSLSALAPACPRAIAVAIQVALVDGDVDVAAALARASGALVDPIVREAALDALVAARDAQGTEALVERNVRDPVFVAHVVARASGTTDLGLRAALLSPLARIPGNGAAAIGSLVAAGRMEDARGALATSSPASIDELMAYATVAIEAGDAERALAWLERARDSGASTLALALQANAYDALGRTEEAARIRAALVSGLAGRGDE